MKKIPTLFKRIYDDDGNIVNVLPEVTNGLEFVFDPKRLVVATVKWDGACCAIIDGVFCKRYDCKPGRTMPSNFIPCDDSQEGHYYGWIPVNVNLPENKWFMAAMKKYIKNFPTIPNGTYEAVGKHFQGNPYGLDGDILVPHGTDVIYGLNRSFEGIKEYLRITNIEGIVFWEDDKPVAKIKKKDFGFKWNGVGNFL